MRVRVPHANGAIPRGSDVLALLGDCGQNQGQSVMCWRFSGVITAEARLHRATRSSPSGAPEGRQTESKYVGEGDAGGPKHNAELKGAQVLDPMLHLVDDPADAP